MCECDDEFSKYVAELAIITATCVCTIILCQARPIVVRSTDFNSFTDYKLLLSFRCGQFPGVLRIDPIAWIDAIVVQTELHSVAKFYPDLLIPDNLNLRIYMYNLHIFSPISKILYSYNHAS